MDDLQYYVAAAALLGVIYAVHGYMAAKRRKDFMEAAQRLGMVYVPDEEAFEAAKLPHPLFRLGHSRSVSNLMHGATAGVEASIFDFSYTTGSGKNRSTHHQTVAAYRLERPLPAFEMLPERFFHFFAELAGYKDIDIAGQSAFSSKYRLLGEDEAAVRGLFTAGVAAALAASPGWTVENKDRTLLVYRNHKRISPRDLERFLSETSKIVQAFALIV